MNIIQSAVTGAVQGLTEFLPVSSSAHLVLTSSLYKFFSGKSMFFDHNEEVLFDIMLHIGTLIAVLFYFRKDLFSLFKNFFSSLTKGGFKQNYESRLPIYVMLGTIATIMVAYPVKDFFESLVEKPQIVGGILLLTGLVLYSTEYISTKIATKTNMVCWKKSLYIGIAQGLAVAPGLSRSGSTIAAGLASGIDRVTCAKYSFLLSIPVIVMAAGYEVLKLVKSRAILHYDWVAMALGTLVSMIIGYLCIKYFIEFLGKHKLNIFAYYCWAMGLFMIIFFGMIK